MFTCKDEIQNAQLIDQLGRNQRLEDVGWVYSQKNLGLNFL